MTKTEKYENEIKRLERQYSVLLRSGSFVKAISLRRDIDKVRQLLDEYKEAIRPRDISEVLSQEEIRDSGLIPALTEIHLVVDYLIACQYALLDICKSSGIDIPQFKESLKDIITRSDKMVSDLMARNGWLLDMMTDNDTLNEAIHKKISSFIKQHTKKPSPKTKHQKPNTKN